MTYALLFPLLLPLVVEDEVVPIEYVKVSKSDPDDVFAFDWSGLDQDGEPTIVLRGAFAFWEHPPSATNPTPKIVAIPGDVVAGPNKYLVRDVLAEIQGGRYRVIVQLFNGQWSRFSNEILVEVISPAPAAATGFTIEERP